MATERKKFMDVKIPLLDSSLSVLTTSMKNLNNKIIKYDLTRILKGKNLEATFVIKANEAEAVAHIKSLLLVPSYIVRMMRNNISYIEDSFKCKTKEGVIIMKPFLLTRKKVHRSVRNALRNKAHEIITEFCSDKSYNEIFDSILSAQIQKGMSAKLKKIYPLSFCEIRAAKIEK